MKRSLIVVLALLLAAGPAVALAACGFPPGGVGVVGASLSSGLDVGPVAAGSDCAAVLDMLQAAPAKMKITSVVPTASHPDGLIYSLAGNKTHAIIVCATSGA